MSKENVEQTLKAIGIDALLTKEEVLLRLNTYKGHQAKFGVFYKDLVKLLDQAADEDFHDVISAYNTPAERIVKFLQTLTSKYSKDDPKLKSEIEYAISNINERKIFQPTSCQRQLSMHPRMSKQNSQIMEWLNEYSEAS